MSEFRLQGRPMFVGIVRDISPTEAVGADLQFLADATAMLTGLVDYETSLRRIARLACSLLRRSVRGAHA